MPVPFSRWQNFYVIVGSAAGALTGLQFIVITLIAQTRATGTMREIKAFGTPTVSHFCSALLISAIMVMPWNGPGNLGICLAVFGCAGIAYAIRVFTHATKSTYKPDFEDWLWYTALPFLAHVALVAVAVLLRWNTIPCLFGLAAITLLFLFLGIHNSWDTVTYIAVQKPNTSSNPES